MTATNHALTGALIGLIVGQPLVAVPAALVSHFVCDALPHFGPNLSAKTMIKSIWFRNYLVAEMVLCGTVVLGLAVFQPRHWLLAAVCAFVAASPDLLSINEYVTIRRHQHWQPNLYTRFAHKIQWFERPIGGVVEAAWFVAGIALLVPFLR